MCTEQTNQQNTLKLIYTDRKQLNIKKQLELTQDSSYNCNYYPKTARYKLSNNYKLINNSISEQSINFGSKCLACETLLGDENIKFCDAKFTRIKHNTQDLEKYYHSTDEWQNLLSQTTVVEEKSVLQDEKEPNIDDFATFDLHHNITFFDRLPLSLIKFFCDIVDFFD